jgi:hypothetical protein
MFKHHMLVGDVNVEVWGMPRGPRSLGLGKFTSRSRNLYHPVTRTNSAPLSKPDLILRRTI